MARVVAVFDDLLLGSNVLGALRAAGHEAELAGPGSARPDGAAVVIVDLGSEGFDGVALVEELRAGGALEGSRTLGVYSHVHQDVRQRAEAAGFDLVVPRSRMAREGPELVARLLADGSGTAAG
jgi:DNA-binding NarL/FixJ family response regulator